jgi:predicted DNA-binding transcriptional regulator AlpA
MEEADDIGINEVQRMFGDVSKTWVDRRLDPASRAYDPDFPQPIQYMPGGHRHWRRSEIHTYQVKKRQQATERRHARRRGFRAFHQGAPDA